jgi:hypothetical protein
VKVTIESISTPNIWQFSTAPELRTYALQDFYTDEGVLVLRGTPGTDEPHLKSQCTLSGSTQLIIPEIEIDSTSIDPPSRYTSLFVTRGRKTPYMSNFAVPAEPNDTTWLGLQIYQRIGRMRFVNPPMAQIQSLMANMIADALTFLRFASETRAGMAASSFAPLDPLFPIHISTTDPNWENFIAGLGMIIAADRATLVDGTVTVPAPAVTANSIITVTKMANMAGSLNVPADQIVEGVSFVINSTDGGDNGDVSWMITEER